jgi:hypothetical protein
MCKSLRTGIFGFGSVWWQGVWKGMQWGGGVAVELCPHTPHLHNPPTLITWLHCHSETQLNFSANYFGSQAYYDLSWVVFPTQWIARGRWWIQQFWGHWQVCAVFYFVCNQLVFAVDVVAKEPFGTMPTLSRSAMSDVFTSAFNGFLSANMVITPFRLLFVGFFYRFLSHVGESICEPSTTVDWTKTFGWGRNAPNFCRANWKCSWWNLFVNENLLEYLWM